MKYFSFFIITQHLTQWGRVMHICASKLISIGSDNGLSPGRQQSIIWNDVKILLTELLGTNFSGILIEIHTFSLKRNAFENVVWEMAAVLSLPQSVRWNGTDSWDPLLSTKSTRLSYMLNTAATGWPGQECHCGCWYYSKCRKISQNLVYHLEWCDLIHRHPESLIAWKFWRTHV